MRKLDNRMIDISFHNNDSNAHEQIQEKIDTHIGDLTAHNIPEQINNTINTHNNDKNAHPSILQKINTLIITQPLFEKKLFRGI